MARSSLQNLLADIEAGKINLVIVYKVDRLTLSLAEELIELSDDRETYFRDPSGVILPDTLWYPSKTFWSIVNNKTRSALPAIERR